MSLSAVLVTVFQLVYSFCGKVTIVHTLSEVSILQGEVDTLANFFNFHRCQSPTGNCNALIPFVYLLRFAMIIVRNTTAAKVCWKIFIPFDPKLFS